jgi:putative (di)nucleoside polyphosphate hydrolase
VPAQVFRAGVVLVVQRVNKDVLVFERGDVPGAWQLPQGGIDVGETPAEAAWRELLEETGLGSDCVRLSWEIPEWITYEWPDSIRSGAKQGDVRRGQVQRWFIFDLVDEGACGPRPDNIEFVAWKWMSRRDVIREVVDFRRDSYRRAFELVS